MNQKNKINESIIECHICGVGSDVMNVDKETMLCNACYNIENGEC